MLSEALAEPAGLHWFCLPCRTPFLPSMLRSRMEGVSRFADTKGGDDEGLQGVGAADADAQQPRPEGLVGGPQLGTVDGDGPGGHLDGGRAVAVATGRARHARRGRGTYARRLFTPGT